MPELSKILEYIPTYQISNSLTSLYNAKKEMENKKKNGYDNYAHRLGMCESSKTGYIAALTGLGSGILKEVYDLSKKTFNGTGFKKALDDSKKDMRNNLEGLKYGLTKDGKDCRIWLMDLDYKTNKWR